MRSAAQRSPCNTFLPLSAGAYVRPRQVTGAAYGIAKEHLILVSDRVSHDPGEIPIGGPACCVHAVLRLDLGTLALEVIDEHRLLKSVEWPFKDAKIENSGSGNLYRFLVHDQHRWPPVRKHLIEQRVRVDYQPLAHLFRIKPRSVIRSISGGVPWRRTAPLRASERSS